MSGFRRRNAATSLALRIIGVCIVIMGAVWYSETRRPLPALVIDDPVATSKLCMQAQTCQDCLKRKGCSWTADRCDDHCWQDAACYGSGNPSATACP